MKLSIANNGYLLIDDARIIWPNFEGRAGAYNREGERSFNLLIPNEEVADILMNDKSEAGVGWNVKIKPPREEGDDPFMFMEVKVKFNGRGPAIWLVTGDRRIQLTEETVKCLDKIDIISVDMDIRPYDSNVRGTDYRTAYLDSMEVRQRVDRFAARAAEGDGVPF